MTKSISTEEKILRVYESIMAVNANAKVDPIESAHTAALIIGEYIRLLSEEVHE